MEHTTVELAQLWVCTDCLMAIANNDTSGAEPGYGGPTLITGRSWPGLAEPCDCTESEQDNGYCECETNTFSRYPCEGCDDHLAGMRHAVCVEV